MANWGYNKETVQRANEYITFSFGVNWRKYLVKLDDIHIHHAQKSFSAFTGLTSLRDHTFLDVGCGSGLNSLIAYQLGAKRIVSMDIDKCSVQCAEDLRARFKIDPSRWVIRQGSILDKSLVDSIGRYSYVYSWGVLHHTGAMWEALDHTARCVSPDGYLHIALYNKHRYSRGWLQIKRLCNRFPRTLFPLMKFSYATYGNARLFARFQSPKRLLTHYKQERGMDVWRDIEDWLGGLPYEYCSVDEVVGFMLPRRFVLLQLKATNTKGCNEFLFGSKRSDI
jgi:2-polyprenyl-6-hydroxyphenyl methylase/3-demethylubiquinone-9 3-methyltransferase